MEKVSTKVDGKIVSPYSEVLSELEWKNIDFSLMFSFSQIGESMKKADYYRDENRISFVQHCFQSSLKKCKKKDDVIKLNEYLKKLSSIGGYAKIFYLKNEKLLKAHLKLQEDDKKVNSPVSYMINGNIKSKYFNTLFDSSSNINFSNSQFLHQLAVADAKRDNDSIHKLTIEFYKLLVECRSVEDYRDLSRYLDTFANVGGYAFIFNNEHKDSINSKGRSDALLELNNKERIKIEINKKFEDFKSNIELLDNAIEELRKKRYLEEKDVKYLLEKYEEHKSYLSSYRDYIDLKTYIEYENHIKESIKYLRKMYETLEEISINSRSIQML